MASPPPSSLFERLVAVWECLALRSDVDDIILELLGRFSLDKIYAGPADTDAYLQLVTGLLAKLNAIFYIQRLSLPSENVQAGRYLGLLASWEVTVRTVDFVLQSLVETHHSLVEGQPLRDEYLPEFLLSTLRFLSLHPKPPTGLRAKDRRDRLARIERSLEQLLGSSPGPRSFLLEVSREATARLYSDPGATGLPRVLKYGLPDLVSGLYPLAECLQPPYISELALPGELHAPWLAQVLALRDVSLFVIGAAIQYEAHGKARDLRLLASCARSRDAVLRALENVRLPPHLNRAEMFSWFDSLLRALVPSTSGFHVDDGRLDALDVFCARLRERRVIHRASDGEVMHNISQVVANIMAQDGQVSQARPTWPELYAVNCPWCHLVGGSQLRCSGVKFASGAEGEIDLSSRSRCPQCGEGITRIREVALARETWTLLQSLEPDADPINLERHVSTQFHLSSPRPEVPGFFGRGSPSPPENGFHEDRGFPAPPATPGEQRGRLGSQPGLLSPPTPEGPRQTPSTPPRPFPGSSTNPASMRPPVERDLDVMSPHHAILDAPMSMPSPRPPPDRPLPHPQTRRTIPVIESPTLGSLPPWQSLNLASSPDKGKSGGWRMKMPGRRKASVSASAADSSSLSELGTEGQRLDEMDLSGLSSGQKSSSKSKQARTIGTCLSQHAHSSLALFWSQSAIYVCDVGPSPPALKTAISTESHCIIATVGLQYLAYIVGTRDQKLTLRIVDLMQPSATGIEYRIPSSQWCWSIAIDQQESRVAVGFVNSVVRFFSTTDNTKPPREDRLHQGRHRDCKACPPVVTLSYSHDGRALLASTRSPKSGLIQVYRWLWPFDACEELKSCQYAVPLHESEDNGISSVLYRSGPDPDADLVCITTWTQSGAPVLIQPQDGHKSGIKSDATSRHSKLGNRVQCAAFSPSGRELALVNDKGHLYQISNLNSSYMEVKRVATSKEMTAKSDAFSLAFMALPDEEGVVMAWADAAKMTGWIKKVAGSYQSTVGPTPTIANFMASPLTPEPANEPPTEPATEVKLAELELTVSPVELPATPSPAGIARSLNQLARKPVRDESFQGKW